MTRRELIRNIVARKNTGRCGTWIGNPDQEALPLYLKESGTTSLEALQQKLNDDVRWITPHYLKSTYQHPEGKKMRWWKDLNPMGLAGGPFAHIESIAEVEKMEWPDIKYLNFDETITRLKNTGDYYRMSGFWAPFYHDLTYMLGTEDLLLKMLTNPEVVHALLDRICNFYLEANELFFREAVTLIDSIFFGNDFGSQNDLLIAPEQYEEFFHPWVVKFSEQAHRHNLQVVLHSCGSIYRIIPRLIDAGVDCINPLQAKAHMMDALTLSKEFKGDIAFMGGIDTQDLMVNGTPGMIRSEVKRVSDLIGPNLIISPSHEALMPNVPLKNVIAMSDSVIKK